MENNFKKTMLFLLCNTFICIIYSTLLFTATNHKVDGVIKVCDALTDVVMANQIEKNNPVSYEGIDKFDALTLAIMKVESEFNPNAINSKSKAIGILQITPIYVAECNRLLGNKVFNHNDAYSVTKSIEMFKFINSKKNPEMDILKAIKIHNPNGGEAYRNKVMKAYAEILRQDRMYLKML